MARSLGILLACVALVWFVSGMWHGAARTATGIADWRSQVAAVAPDAGFAIQAPASLPAGWSVSALQLTGSPPASGWTMTVTTPTGHYLDLDQVVGGLAKAAALAVPDGTPVGTVELRAGTWTRYRLPPDAQGAARAGLGRAVGATAVVISGTGSPAEQARFAEELRATR